MDLNWFFYEYFAKPVYVPGTQGYNLVNTAVYGAILLVLSFFVIFPFLNKREVKFNARFCIALIPYILIGTSLRAITSSGLLPGVRETLNPLEFGFWTFTPGVWFLTFFIAIFGLFFARWLERKKAFSFESAFLKIGLCFSFPLLLFQFLHFSNWLGFFAVIIAVIVVSLAIAFVLKKIKFFKKIASTQNLLAVSGQVIDGTATGFAIFFYGFKEQHPLSEAVINISPVLFLLLKIFLVLAIVYYTDTEIKNENLKGFIKTFLIIMGFATGIASILKIGLV
ncbi:MAG: DUF63 family protein [Candidatus Diapherotrites archaeon]